MAQRRMFSKEVTTSDLFVDMPSSSQLLYFHLGMEADDEGFIGNAKMLSRAYGSNNDDLKLLEAKGFIIAFPSGVTVVKDWNLNNKIRKDRVKATIYTEEKTLLSLDSKGSYLLGNQVSTISQPNDNQMSAQDRIGKDRLGEVSIGEGRGEQKEPSDFQRLINLYQENFGIVKPILYDDLKADINDYGLELIVEAVKRSTKKQKDYAYAQGILKSWNRSGIKTLEQAKAEEVSFQNKSQNNQNGFQQQKPVKSPPEWTDEGRLIKAGVDTTGMTQNEMYKLAGEMGLHNE
ncbi:DnaD domain protein [Lactococcus lactis]|uniref:DnaD domain-containing protein n=1 Tax=Lactococcus lactis TaxID=1358 RepID=UPI002417487C|nr:DnaD domain protein [Lactococcus lactis]MDG4985521.1 DnaD domain protein [Lactococcus lactis]